MKNKRIWISLVLSTLMGTWWGVRADVHYVAPSGSSTPPYDSWINAATNIQDAVYASTAGDTVLVTNGVYASGGLAWSGSTTSRVAVIWPITLASVNGPDVTTIQGQADPLTTNGPAAVRCVWLHSGSVLSGFTLNGGNTSDIYPYEGGGALCEAGAVISNCHIVGNSSWYNGGGVYQGTLYDCVVSDNTARRGGGGDNSTFIRCTIENNFADGDGGGAYNSTLIDCTVSNNRATQDGGGLYRGTASNCLFEANRAKSGGALYRVDAWNCLLNGNIVTYEGGGSHGGELYDCVLSDNHATNNISCGWWGAFCLCEGLTYGGGAFGGQLHRCELVGNSANYLGGGVIDGILRDCIIRDNWITGIPPGEACSSEWGGSYGGGASRGILYNCLILNNHGPTAGGGTSYSIGYNCTIYGNSAEEYGAGVLGGTQYNGIVHGNTVSNMVIVISNGFPHISYEVLLDNWSSTDFVHSNTDPAPPGPGNIQADPMFVAVGSGDFHLRTGSPCINTGTNQLWMSGAVDLDGRRRISRASQRVDMGAYEYVFPPAPEFEVLGQDASYVLTGAEADRAAGTHLGDVQIGQMGFTTLVLTNAGAEALAFGSMTTNGLRAGRFAVGSIPAVLAPGQTATLSIAYTPDAFTIDQAQVLLPHNASNITSPFVLNLAGVGRTSTNGGMRFHVVKDNPTAAVPYTNWTTAAATIQTAIDFALKGDLVIVSNGVYDTGGRVMQGATTNRVVLTEQLTVRSVNGPDMTTILGYQDPVTTNGDSAVRCAYVGREAVLSGFTLTHGAGDYGGGVWAAYNGVVSNCVIVGNTASFEGGGGYDGRYYGCTISDNRSRDGGGVSDGYLTGCLLTNNHAQYSGGAAYNSSLTRCTLVGNRASSGGGAVGERYEGWPSGTFEYDSYLSDCALINNHSEGYGGGVVSMRLWGCTVVGNQAGIAGGGVYASRLMNSIAYYNLAPQHPNHHLSEIKYSCTTPLPVSGVGNIDDEPRLADASHLSAGSPCIGRGLANLTSGLDLDGEPWLAPPSMGCDEFYAGSITGPLSVAIHPPTNTLSPGWPLDLAARIEGHASSNHWSFGEGSIAENRPFVQHQWDSRGTYEVILTVYNEDHPVGVSATAQVHVTEAIHYVALENPTPVPPYTSWPTAATNIQDALDAIMAPGSRVLVSNGVYAVGGQVVHGALTNRIAITGPTTVQSVNGPAVTIIEGQYDTDGSDGPSAVRCAYITNGASLVGFTLTRGASGWGQYDREGGGAWCEPSAILSNCVFTGNLASDGGGAFQGIFFNCTFSNNVASDGGGVYGGQLYDSILRENTASDGGGAYNADLYHCSLTGNSATSDGGAAYWGVLHDCVVSGNRAEVDGGGTCRATLHDCTITGNITGSPTRHGYGGGVSSGIVSNSLVAGNTAIGNGGGIEGGYVYNSIIVSNTAAFGGGGTYGSYRLYNNVIAHNTAGGKGGGANAYDEEIHNCTIVGNTAGEGGGSYYGTLYNCIVYFNQATNAPNYHDTSSLVYSCSSPLPPGAGNLANDPLLINWLAGDYALATNSPCIDVGNNTYAREETDVLGHTRIIDGTIDLGALEFHGASASIIPLPWLVQYGLPTDGSVDDLDLDFDGFTTWAEWRTGTVPTDGDSFLQFVFTPVPITKSGVVLSWASVTGKTYRIDRSRSLLAYPVFESIASNIVGQVHSTQYTDTTPMDEGPFFYRVRVE